MNYTYTFSTDCIEDLIYHINTTLSVTVQQVRGAGDDLTFVLDRTLDAGEQTTLDGIISGWTCPEPDVSEKEVNVDLTSAQAGEAVVWDGTKFVPQNVVTSYLVHASFCYESTAKNRWLPMHAKGSKSSNETPFIVPFDMAIKCLTYSFENSSTDTDVQIWTTPAGQNPSSNKALRHTEELRDARNGVITGLDLSVSAGDMIAVYLADKGTDAKGVNITLWLESPKIVPTAVAQNVSGNF